VGERIGDEMVEIEAKVEHTTSKAWLIIDNMSQKQAWLPKSVGTIVQDVDMDGNTIFNVKEWWARKNGLI
jgi:hypothetical protein